MERKGGKERGKQRDAPSLVQIPATRVQMKEVPVVKML